MPVSKQTLEEKMDNLVEDLKKFGFTEYEAKAYMALLKEFPVNGYVLSKNSAIPRSRIYEVVQSLLEKGAILRTGRDETPSYHPLPPEVLVNRLKRQYIESLGRLGTNLSGLQNQGGPDQAIKVLKGHKAIMDLSLDLIDGAKSKAALSIWAEELAIIKPALEKAAQRGVQLKGITFGEAGELPGDFIAHRRAARVLAESAYRRPLVIVVDGYQVLYGVASQGNDSQATWTGDQGFVNMAEDYILHDICLNKVMIRFGGELRRELEEELDRVRAEFLGLDEQEVRRLGGGWADDR